MKKDKRTNNNVENTTLKTKDQETQGPGWLNELGRWI